MSNKVVKFKGCGLLRSNSWKPERIGPGPVALWRYKRFMSLLGDKGGDSVKCSVCRICL